MVHCKAYARKKNMLERTSDVSRQECGSKLLEQVRNMKRTLELYRK